MGDISAKAALIGAGIAVGTMLLNVLASFLTGKLERRDRRADSRDELQRRNFIELQDAMPEFYRTVVVWRREKDARSEDFDSSQPSEIATAITEQLQTMYKLASRIEDASLRSEARRTLALAVELSSDIEADEVEQLTKQFHDSQLALTLTIGKRLQKN